MRINKLLKELVLPIAFLIMAIAMYLISISKTIKPRNFFLSFLGFVK